MSLCCPVCSPIGYPIEYNRMCVVQITGYYIRAIPPRALECVWEMGSGGVSYGKRWGFLWICISDHIWTISGPYLQKYAYLSISVAYLTISEPYLGAEPWQKHIKHIKTISATYRDHIRIISADMVRIWIRYDFDMLRYGLNIHI